MIAAILLAWLKLLALDGDLAKAEPKTLRYRIMHAAVRLVRGGRRRRLKIQATWPWAAAIMAAWQRIDALPQAPLTSTNPSQRPGKDNPRPVEPRPPDPPAGLSPYPSTKIRVQNAAPRSSSASHQPR